jgi:hypothetical protein
MPVDQCDEAVLRKLRSMLLPPAAVEMAREELRRRLALPSHGTADEIRARLEKRLERLRLQHEWSEIEHEEFRVKTNETKAELALLPEPDKITTFDQVAALVSSLGRALDAASPEQVRELIRMLVERVTTSAGEVSDIEIVPAARPFFAARESLLMAPPDGFEPPTQALGRPRSIH